MKVVITLNPYITIDDFETFDVNGDKLFIHCEGGKIYELPVDVFGGLCVVGSSIWEQSKFNKGGKS